MNRAIAATPASDTTNAATTRASALRLTMSMKVAVHKASGPNTENVAHNRKRKSPNQLFGRPSQSVSKDQSATKRLRCWRLKPVPA